MVTRVLLFAVFSLQAAPATAQQKKPAEKRENVPRPRLSLTLRDGSKAVGRLERFVDGVYTLRVAGDRFLNYDESQVAELQFVPRPALRDMLQRAVTKSKSRIPTPEIKQIARRGPKILDSLLSYAKEDSGGTVVVGKIVAELGPSSVAELIGVVRRDSANALKYVLINALTGLKSAGDPLVIRMLNDSEIRFREIGLTALYHRRKVPAPMLPKVVALLEDDSYAIRKLAVTLSSKDTDGGDAAVVRGLQKLIEFERAEGVATTAVHALARMIDQQTPAADARQELVRSLQRVLATDSRYNLQSTIISIAPRLGFSETQMIDLVKRYREKPQLRRAADSLASQIGFDLLEALAVAKIKQPLAKLVRDYCLVRRIQSRQTQAREQQLLKELRKVGPAALDALVIAIREGSRDGRGPHLTTVAQYWPATANASLKRHAADKDPQVRRFVAQLLGMIRQTEVPDLAKQLIQDEDMWVRSATMTSLGQMVKSGRPALMKDAVPLLIERLQNDAEKSGRQDAAQVLGKFGARHELVVPALVARLAKEPDEETRSHLADDLGDICSALRQDSKLAKSIIHALAERAVKDTSVDVRYSAVSGLHIGTESEVAIKALKVALDDDYALVSEAAARALRSIEETKADQKAEEAVEAERKRQAELRRKRRVESAKGGDPFGGGGGGGGSDPFGRSGTAAPKNPFKNPPKAPKKSS